MNKEIFRQAEIAEEFNPFKTYESIKQDSFISAEFNGPLQGEVKVSGTKNMVSKAVAACLSAEKGKAIIKNIPFVGDLDITLALCRRLGINYKVSPDKTLELAVGEFSNPNVLSDPYHGNRVAILFAGPVLAKLGKANVSKPEGCKIGERKIDYHLAGLEKFGVEIIEHEDWYAMRLKNSTLQGARFDLPFPSVGTTENLIITASCAQGETILNNCALEPEIIELVKILQCSGVEIGMYSPRTIIIKGGEHHISSPIEISPDRVEAASLAIAALSSKGDVFIRDAEHEPLITFIGILNRMGAGMEIQNDGIRFFWKHPLKSIGNITTGVYPGFPTDFQQPMAVLMSQAEGVSMIHETIFENRFNYLEELNKVIRFGKPMIALRSCPDHQKCRFNKIGYKHLAKIEGPIEFGSGEIEIKDMRAGFASINTAIISSGIVVKNLKGLYRGYEDPVGKLKSLGAKIDLKI